MWTSGWASAGRWPVDERPILFSGPMVRAILAGTKTQTRRVVKWRPSSPADVSATRPPDEAQPYFHITGAWLATWTENGQWSAMPTVCPYGVPGDRLWVRETWRAWSGFGETVVEYAADGAKRIAKDWHIGTPDLHITGNDLAHYDHGEWCNRIGRQNVDSWRPSIHMPRAASRLTLEVTEVRVERLTQISSAEALLEGVTLPAGRDASTTTILRDAHAAFVQLWQSINGKRPGCAWHDDPWVWVVSFRRVEVPRG